MTQTLAGKRMVITGSSGLVGSALTKRLAAQHANVVRMVRRAPATENEVRWDFQGPIPPEALACEAFLHLAGEPIVGLWTPEKKRRMRESRIVSTGRIAEAMGAAARRPRTLIVASGVGYYGSRGDELLTEASSQGSGFLAELARDWEAAAEPARKAGVRVVHLRLGIVLAKEGGALKKMMTPFRLGLGAVLGEGTQWMSWIGLADVTGAIEHILLHPQISGPVNLVTPEPVTNAEFTGALARALGRRAFLRAPESALKLLGGEMAREMLLASQRAVPAKLSESGFVFEHPQIRGALDALLG